MRFNTKLKIENVVSNDVTREHINSIHHDKVNKRLMATDGFIGVIVQVSENENDDVGSIPVEALKVARKAKAGTISINDGRINVGAVSFVAHDAGQFPDLAYVLPKFKPGGDGVHTITLDASLLKKLAEALSSDAEEKYYVRISFRDADAAMIVEPYRGSETVGVIMPVREPVK